MEKERILLTERDKVLREAKRRCVIASGVAQASPTNSSLPPFYRQVVFCFYVKNCVVLFFLHINREEKEAARQLQIQMDELRIREEEVIVNC